MRISAGRAGKDKADQAGCDDDLIEVAVESTKTKVSREEASSRLRFRGDIEGLRGVAIGIGVVGHLYEDYGTTQAAHTIPAMDIFFAMSGFLITSLLVKEYRESSRKPEKRTISLTRFYERRARRILPAALVVNAAILVGAWLTFNKVRFAETQQHAYWSAIWGENFHLINVAADYFSLQQVKSPFQHYWSLAVEEQFYLFWPAVFLLAVKGATWKRIPFIRGDWRKSLMLVTAAIAIPSFVVSIVTSYANPAAAYFSTFNRAWVILIGAAAAIAPQLRYGLGPRASKAASWAGAALIVAGVAVVGYGDPYPGFLGLFAAVGTTLLMVAGMGGGLEPRSRRSSTAGRSASREGSATRCTSGTGRSSSSPTS